MSVQNMTVTTTMRFRRDCASALPSSEAWIAILLIIIIIIKIIIIIIININIFIIIKI